jgi:hypothetical protein
VNLKKRLLSKVVLSVLFTILWSGCASSVYYKTELDPMYKIEKQKKIFVFLPNSPTIEDKKFMLSLKEKLKLNNFNVVDKYPADYGIFFTLTSKSYSSNYTVPITTPTTSYSSGYVGGTYYSGTTTGSKTTYYSGTSRTTYKKIYVDIMNSTKNSQGKYETIWSGFMSANIEDYYENPNAMINELVKLIGKEFKGDISVELDKPNT